MSSDSSGVESGVEGDSKLAGGPCDRRPCQAKPRDGPVTTVEAFRQIGVARPPVPVLGSATCTNVIGGRITFGFVGLALIGVRPPDGVFFSLRRSKARAAVETPVNRGAIGRDFGSLSSSP